MSCAVVQAPVRGPLPWLIRARARARAMSDAGQALDLKPRSAIEAIGLDGLC